MPSGFATNGLMSTELGIAAAWHPKEVGTCSFCSCFATSSTAFSLSPRRDVHDIQHFRLLMCAVIRFFTMTESFKEPENTACNGLAVRPFRRGGWISSDTAPGIDAVWVLHNVDLSPLTNSHRTLKRSKGSEYCTAVQLLCFFAVKFFLYNYRCFLKHLFVRFTARSLVTSSWVYCLCSLNSFGPSNCGSTQYYFWDLIRWNSNSML